MSKIGVTTATIKIRKLTKRIRAIQGGTAASKTFSVLLHLIDQAQRDKIPTITSVVSESFPHLKKGAIRDFLQILKELNRFNDNSWNKTDYTYIFENGSRIEFFSVDQPGKVRGPRRDRLFLNEANNIPYETFEQLEIRTKEFIFLDWNPSEEFWFYTEILGKRDDLDHIILTYKDNEALDKQIVDAIEVRRNNYRFWKVYGLGELGEAIGRIYTGWQMIDEVPHEARLERYGLDFGYDPDPAAIIAIYYWNGGYILDEILYAKRLENPELASTLRNLPRALVIADSAEPKSIAEIQGFGINVIATEKGKDSVRYGVKTMQGLRISVTKRSINLIREYRNYFQAIDRKTNTQIMGEYEGDNHALDAVRYGLCSLIPIQQRKEYMQHIPRLMLSRKRNPV